MSHVRVQLAPRGRIQRVPLDEYVRGVLLAEAAVGVHDGAAGARMLEVQAIVARTYALAHRSRHGRDGFDLCATTHCQVYAPGRRDGIAQPGAVAEAVRQTSGLVIWHGSRPASAVFHADCGGHTSAARDVWGGEAHPYLAAAADTGPARAVHRTWQFEVEDAVLRRALNRDPRTRVGSRLTGVTVAGRDAAGRASRIRLQGSTMHEVRGEDFRAVVNQGLGAGALLSTRFDVRRVGTALQFTGRGHGHGVGLCQVGALARLRAGASVARVLAHYYPGTDVRRVP